MANKRAFEIAFVGLKPGLHQFEYELDDQFFLDRGAKELSQVQANVKLNLDKHNGFLMLQFEIGGQSQVTCDRCGNPLKLDLWDEFKMLVKMVDNPEEMNEQEEDADVYYISRNESHLDVAGWLYDFVLLSMPMQRMCSESEMGGPQCNREVLQKLKEMEARNQENNDRSLWKGLDKFKYN
ncbi:MAG TPA: DUF177 domain-containing protein [Ferruginibacter sp.]|nr:DUF177 domain-containing protein [Ferruginibacter sp.]